MDEVGFAPLDDTGTQLLFRLVAAAYERRSLAIGSHRSFDQWGRFLPEHTTAVSILDRLPHHATVVRLTAEPFERHRPGAGGGGYAVVVVITTVWSTRPAMATARKCGQGPPMLTRRAKARQLSQRCSPRSRSLRSGHS